jgi:drug/metabolite transporter (DMT)-like permease
MVTATVLALGAALLHATWNLILKVSDERDAAFWAQWLLGAAVAVPVLLVIGLPDRGAWPFLAASATIQVLYVTGLARAYTHGDFSFAYPLARGSGALLAALGGTVLLDEHLGLVPWIGVAVVACSLLMLMGRGASRASLTWAIFTGVAIGAYSLVDAQGSRHAGSGASYGFSLQVCTGITLSIAGFARHRQGAMVGLLRTSFWRLFLAGVLVAVSYTMVVIAFQDAPVGYVSVLRESSVVIGALLGWLFLHERLGRHRLVSSLVMVGGLVLLVGGS